MNDYLLQNPAYRPTSLFFTTSFPFPSLPLKRALNRVKGVLNRVLC